jgi:hypothetical protein
MNAGVGGLTIGPARATTHVRTVAQETCRTRSEDLIEQEGGEFVVLRSPDTAEHDPDYRELGRFSTRAKAEEFLASFEEV